MGTRRLTTDAMLGRTVMEAGPPLSCRPPWLDDPNAISTGLDGSLRVFWRLDAFDEDGQPGEGLDLINIGRNKVRFCRGVNLGNAFADPVLEE